MKDRSSSKALACTEDLYHPNKNVGSDVDSVLTVHSSEGSYAFVEEQEKSSPPVLENTPPATQGKNKLGISGRKKAKMSLLDDKTFGFLDTTRDIEMEKLAEVKRHNLVIEQGNLFHKKTSELEYKMKLYDSFNIMRDQGMSEEKIFVIFPDMKVFNSE